MIHRKRRSSSGAKGLDLSFWIVPDFEVIFNAGIPLRSDQFCACSSFRRTSGLLRRLRRGVFHLFPSSSAGSMKRVSVWLIKLSQDGHWGLALLVPDKKLLTYLLAERLSFSAGRHFLNQNVFSNKSRSVGLSLNLCDWCVLL